MVYLAATAVCSHSGWAMLLRPVSWSGACLPAARRSCLASQCSTHLVGAGAAAGLAPGRTGGLAGHADVYLDYLERQSDQTARYTGGRGQRQRGAADALLRGAIQQHFERVIVERSPELGSPGRPAATAQSAT